MKKNILNWMIIALMAFVCAGLAACGGDDSEPNPIPTPTDPVPPGTPSAGAVAVDLGLPSGTKWANMNVGATKPEEYGLYFAWGETVGYGLDTSDGHKFDWDSYKWCNVSYDLAYPVTSLTKYCTSTGNNYGTVDNKTVLDLADDAAYVNWGDKWRMPTIEEIKELLDNTTSEWTTLNGVYGRKFTSKTNGNSIFLPATGDRDGDRVYDQGSYGNYWSASVEKPAPSHASNLKFTSEDQRASNSSRCDGEPVRPVLRN